MTKKHIKSKNQQNHKKPMHKQLLKEEFGTELGDYNAGKIYDILAKENQKDDQDRDENC